MKQLSFYVMTLYLIVFCEGCCHQLSNKHWRNENMRSRYNLWKCEINSLEMPWILISSNTFEKEEMLSYQVLIKREKSSTLKSNEKVARNVLLFSFGRKNLSCLEWRVFRVKWNTHVRNSTVCGQQKPKIYETVIQLGGMCKIPCSLHVCAHIFSQFHSHSYYYSCNANFENPATTLLGAGHHWEQFEVKPLVSGGTISISVFAIWHSPVLGLNVSNW